MRISQFWVLAILLMGLAGCGGTSSTTSPEKSFAQWIESGNAALARSEPDQALEDFSRALEAQADSTLALERRAATFLQMKKYDQALVDCNSALRIDNKFATAYFVRGQVEERQGDREKAREDFTKALENSLERADVLAARGMTYRSLAKSCRNPDESAKILQEAMKDFNRALKIDPKQAGIRLQRALVELDIGDYAAAVTDCEAAISADPKLVEAYVARARGECELGEIDRALGDCDRAIQMDENCMEAYINRANARLERASEMRTLKEVAECAQALDDCQKSIALAKKIKGDEQGMNRANSIRGRAHELRGLIYHNLPATKRALDEYSQALSLDPYLVSALLRRAVTRSLVNDDTGALNDCNTAIGLDSARPDAYSGRGLIYSVKREFSKAIEDFTQAVQLDPRCAKAFQGRAAVYSAMATIAADQARHSQDAAEQKTCQEKSQEYRKKSIEDATEAIKANSHLAKAYLTRALAYGRLNIADKALADFNAAIREDPRMIRAYYNRAVLFYRKGRVDDAIKDFLECEMLSPENPLLSYRLGQCYEQKNDRIMMAKYAREVKEKSTRRQQPTTGLDEPSELISRLKPTTLPDLRPDADLDPLQKAKNDLQSKLDSTAEQ